MNRDVNKLANGVIEYLKNTNQLKLLPELINTLEQINRNLSNSNKAIVESSYKLSTIELGQIQKALFYIFKKKLIVLNRVDRDLIGGLKITVQDKVIDLSLEKTLENLKNKIDHD